MDKTIKAHLCEEAHRFESNEIRRNEVLRALRPWPSHADHFHMRLKCPESNLRCISGPPIPEEGNGCASTVPQIRTTSAAEVAP